MAYNKLEDGPCIASVMIYGQSPHVGGSKVYHQTINDKKIMENSHSHILALKDHWYDIDATNLSSTFAMLGDEHGGILIYRPFEHEYEGRHGIGIICSHYDSEQSEQLSYRPNPLAIDFDEETVASIVDGSKLVNHPVYAIQNPWLTQAASEENIGPDNQESRFNNKGKIGPKPTKLFSSYLPESIDEGWSSIVEFKGGKPKVCAELTAFIWCLLPVSYRLKGGIATMIGSDLRGLPKSIQLISGKVETKVEKGPDNGDKVLKEILFNFGTRKMPEILESTWYTQIDSKEKIETRSLLIHELVQEGHWKPDLDLYNSRIDMMFYEEAESGLIDFIKLIQKKVKSKPQDPSKKNYLDEIASTKKFNDDLFKRIIKAAECWVIGLRKRQLTRGEDIAEAEDQPLRIVEKLTNFEYKYFLNTIGSMWNHENMVNNIELDWKAKIIHYLIENNIHDMWGTTKLLDSPEWIPLTNFHPDTALKRKDTLFYRLFLETPNEIGGLRILEELGKNRSKYKSSAIHYLLNLKDYPKTHSIEIIRIILNDIFSEGNNLNTYKLLHARQGKTQHSKKDLTECLEGVFFRTPERSLPEYVVFSPMVNRNENWGLIQKLLNYRFQENSKDENTEEIKKWFTRYTITVRGGSYEPQNRMRPQIEKFFFNWEWQCSNLVDWRSNHYKNISPGDYLKDKRFKNPHLINVQVKPKLIAALNTASNNWKFAQAVPNKSQYDEIMKSDKDPWTRFKNRAKWSKGGDSPKLKDRARWVITKFERISKWVSRLLLISLCSLLIMEVLSHWKWALDHSPILSTLTEDWVGLADPTVRWYYIGGIVLCILLFWLGVQIKGRSTKMKIIRSVLSKKLIGRN